MSFQNIKPEVLRSQLIEQRLRRIPHTYCGRRHAVHFHKVVTDFLIASFQINGLAQAGLSLGHLDRLTLPRLTVTFGATSQVLYTCHHWEPLCRRLLGG
jgi:tRNA 2-selenouridine synthase SelU